MKQKILFVLPSLRGGGAERVMYTIVNNLNREKFELHMALISKEGPYIDSISKDVMLYDLHVKKVRNAFIPLLKLVRSLKPHIIFSTMGHLNIALIMLKPFFHRKTRLVIREATIVSEAIRRGQLGKYWRYIYKIFYNKADRIVCQSKYMERDLIENYNVYKEITMQIYNPVDIELVTAKAKEDQNPFLDTESTPNIIAIGRLDPVKGFEQLIESMQTFIESKPSAKLWILGEGTHRKQLQKKITDLGLQDNVVLYGFVKNPYSWMRHADLFVLSSLYEGLPNTLIEAIGCGCPVVTTRHPGGTVEIMEALKYEDRIVEKILFTSDLFSRNEKTDEYIKNFGLKNVIQQYENLFQQL